ncbi:hypothetical protein [Actinoplanes sp. NBRC 103695]|uniref:hypothetical protein n=1 Tax=Actinoplanes sp. NBRC 103695 TaxID=3032202 RepID=UPI0024A01E52|nr:hypothetical protein [Actinoplanes sp. NBRC 103695]GLY94289.1 hypothetical protein Acsp02_15450 [Actinoplanes sp. NBRC 103695]
MSYVRKTVILVVAASALVGCAKPAGPAALPSAPSVAPPAATSSPSAAPTSAPAKGSGGGTDSWDGVDFREVLFRELGCTDVPESKGKAVVFSTQRTDLTGDGRTEAVVAGSCFVRSGADHAYVFVYDGADAGERPTSLVQIGKDQDLTSARVKIGGDKVTVTSDALSGQAPTCCPDLRITQTYVWDGDEFSRENITEKNL